MQEPGQQAAHNLNKRAQAEQEVLEACQTMLDRIKEVNQRAKYLIAKDTLISCAAKAVSLGQLDAEKLVALCLLDDKDPQWWITACEDRDFSVVVELIKV